ncbi:peptidoglycan recognition protein family protein, partial [Patescibacteria group bacterium]|nr:peptidoglycan recognition protein family protein [Patescibacteria group bacterium]
IKMKKVLNKSKPFLVIFAAILIAAFILPVFPSQAASSELTIISRSAWEADSDYLLNENKKVIWPVTYQKPVKFVVHHTAGSNGSSNPEATIRAIYYYHAQILGWGDIGYNYLIDAQGNIYEGRKGGDGAIGAHAYRDAGCNVARFGGESKGVDFNAGTIGIAILGNYENNIPLTKAINALVKLIAQKSADLGINPKGVSNWRGLTKLPNIVGHKDVDCTLCPGSNLESKLEIIRTSTNNRYLELKDTGASFQPIVKAQFIKQSATSIQLEPGATATISATYKNTGNFTWRRYYDDTVYLSSANYDEDSLLHLSAVTDNHIDLITGNVEPGGNGIVSFVIKAPVDSLSVSETFYLAYDGQEIAGTRFTVAVEVVGLDFATEISSQNILPATFVNSQVKTTFQFVNRGIKTWNQGEVYLNIYDLEMNPSIYQDSSWRSQYGGIDLTEQSVKPGETGTFSFYLNSPKTPGFYRQLFKLVSSDQEIINGEVDFITRVDSHYQAKLISHNIPPAISVLWRPTATIKFKNTGAATWEQNLRLAVYDLGFATSKFQDSSWGNGYGQFRLKETSVAPGQIGTFEYYYRNRQPGIYKQLFVLGIPGKEVTVADGNFDLITRVD